MWLPRTPQALAKLILFVAGLAGIAHQELTGSQPALLPVYAVMMGLPAFVGIDDWLRRDKDGGRDGGAK